MHDDARQGWEKILERAEHEHDELSTRWYQLDSKAQGTAALASMFLAAVVAFSKPEVGCKLSQFERIAGVLLGISLMITVLLALKAMRVTYSAIPPLVGEKKAMLKDALRGPIEESRLAFTTWLSDISAVWESANCEIAKTVDKKASMVRCAQNAAVVSAMIAGALIVYRFIIH